MFYPTFSSNVFPNHLQNLQIAFTYIFFAPAHMPDGLSRDLLVPLPPTVQSLMLPRDTTKECIVTLKLREPYRIVSR